MKKGIIVSLVAVVAAAGLLIAADRSSAATASYGWKKVAQANDSSEYYASANLMTHTSGARYVQLTYAASGTAQYKGTVICTRGFNIESRDFSFYARRGHRNLPLPIEGAACDWTITASMVNGGGVAVALWSYR
jgi:hypothetical protein